MLDQPTREITKADVDRFLHEKHIVSCPVCGRFRSQCDVDVRSLGCQRAPAEQLVNASLDILMISCQNCGAIQFHDRKVIAQWVDCRARLQHK